jgi:hypothetical protein
MVEREDRLPCTIVFSLLKERDMGQTDRKIDKG